MDSRGDLAHVLDPAPGIAESQAEQPSRAGAWIPRLGELEVDEGGGQAPARHRHEGRGRPAGVPRRRRWPVVPTLHTVGLAQPVRPGTPTATPAPAPRTRAARRNLARGKHRANGSPTQVQATHAVISHPITGRSERARVIAVIFTDKQIVGARDPEVRYLCSPSVLGPGFGGVPGRVLFWLRCVHCQGASAVLPAVARLVAVRRWRA